MKTYSSPARGRFVRKSAHMVIDFRLYSFRAYRANFHGGIVFDVQQQDGVAEFRRDLVRIEEVEEDHFVAVIAERFDDLDDRVRDRRRNRR